MMLFLNCAQMKRSDKEDSLMHMGGYTYAPYGSFAHIDSFFYESDLCPITVAEGMHYYSQHHTRRDERAIRHDVRNAMVTPRQRMLCIL